MRTMKFISDGSLQGVSYRVIITDRTEGRMMAEECSKCQNPGNRLKA